MNVKIFVSAVAVSMALLLSGCSSTTSYSESEVAKAKMKQHGCKGGKCSGKSCRDCSKTIYTAKDRMSDEVYK